MEHGILKKKWYLYITEFFAGMSVMAVELGASRLLAPYFSSSQIVWTIIIGTIMIAMALGNIYGGKSADKSPDPDKLYRRMLIAALWIAAIPFAGKYIIVGITGLLVLAVNSGFLIIAAFAACMVIFVFPLFLLGTVTPCLVKYTTESLDDNGKTVGTLGAFNTVGSIIGTFTPTFITIPAFGTAITFLIFAGILLTLCIIYFVSKKTKLLQTIISILLFVAFSVAGAFGSFAFWDNSLIYEGESTYNYLQVKDDERRVVLSTNVLFGVQSVKMKNGTLTGMYYDYALAAPAMAGLSESDEADVLILGMGTGTYATQLKHFYPNFNIEGVEIDEKITELAREYFDMPDDIKVTTYDGRAYLNVIDKKYDVIMVDAYQDITIPFQMSSVEFFTLVSEHLTDGGIMVVNMNMRSDDGGGINACLKSTICSVFDFVYTVDVGGTTNCELFASNSDFKEGFGETALAVRDDALRSRLAAVSKSLAESKSDGRILTDDCAPVELLGMSVIDGMINKEIGYYQKIFKEKGIKGLIEELQ